MTMEPLNKKERTSFLLKFLVTFIIGILIVLIPFYFLLRLPEFENDIMTKDFRNMQEQMKYQKDVFAVQVDAAMSLVNKYDIPNQDIDKLNADLGLLISEMEKPFVSDTTWSGKMYNNVVKSFIDLKKAKNDKMRSQIELMECKKDLEKAKEEAEKNKDTMGG